MCFFYPLQTEWYNILVANVSKYRNQIHLKIKFHQYLFEHMYSSLEDTSTITSTDRQIGPCTNDYHYFMMLDHLMIGGGLKNVNDTENKYHCFFG